MTALPGPPSHLLTVAEYAALGETEPGYTELQEGRLLMSPSPSQEHNVVSGELYVQLRAQIPDQLQVIQDIDLELVPANKPGFSRRPDLKATQVQVVIEIVSPGSRRTEFGHQEAPAVTGTFAVSEPFPVKIDVEQLN